MSKKNDEKNTVMIILTKYFRIQDSIKWLLISFVGFILGMTELSIKVYFQPLLVFIIATISIMAFTFAINNYFDIESDKINPRRKNINAIGSEISRRTGFYLLIILALISLITSILYNHQVFIFCGFLLFLGWEG